MHQYNSQPFHGHFLFRQQQTFRQGLWHVVSMCLTTATEGAHQHKSMRSATIRAQTCDLIGSGVKNDCSTTFQ